MPWLNRKIKYVKELREHDCNPFEEIRELVKVQKLKNKFAESALDENPEICLAALEELRNALKVKTLTNKLARAAYGESSGICLAALDTLTSAVGSNGNGAYPAGEAAPDTPRRLKRLMESLEPRRRFTVKLNKPPQIIGKKLGISICVGDGKALVVSGISEGLVQDWNAKQTRNKRVEVGDHIVSVDGETAPLMTLRDAMLKATGEFSFEVEPHTEFTISVTRGESDRLGLNVCDKPNDMTLLVTGIVDGIIQVWNASQKGQMVLAGDRICAVNGEMGPGNFLRKRVNEMRGDIKLTILRVQKCPAPA